MNSQKFKKNYGSWALITGASEGIGRAFAMQLAKDGFNLAIVARREDLLVGLHDEMQKSYGISVKVIVADLSTTEGTAKVIAESDGLDLGLFIAAAGYGTSGNFINNPLTKELAMIDLNCRSVVEQTQHFAKLFKDQGRGGIILFGSLVGFQGTPRAANYAATKAFIQVFAEGLRVEMKQFGVDVLAVAPGPVNSGFSKRADMQMGNVDKPVDVAKGALAVLGKKTTARPGVLGKILGYSMCITPRPFRVMIMRSVMGGMTRHRS